MTGQDGDDLIKFPFPDEIDRTTVSEQRDGPVEPLQLGVSVNKDFIKWAYYKTSLFLVVLQLCYCIVLTMIDYA
ncbi:MAG: hypothetical protein U5K99_06765 [Anaerolineales bacterium]|nr:hypothetical protein [Anaerolineales bacterium]